MPKPTFLQTVLRKPTRSYADPNAVSPWADQADPDPYYATSGSRYSPRKEMAANLRSRRDGPDEAGPSWRSSGSSVSSDMDVSPSTMGTRFPKATKKANSGVVVREGGLVKVPLNGDGKPRRDGTAKKKKKKVLGAAPNDAGPRKTGTKASATLTVGRATGPFGLDDGGSSASSSQASSQVSFQQSSPAMAKSKTTTPQQNQAAYSETSSDASSIPAQENDIPSQRSEKAPLPKTQSKPAVPAIQGLTNTTLPPLTPPSSDMSSTNPSRDKVVVRVKSVQLVLPPTPKHGDSPHMPQTYTIVAPSDDIEEEPVDEAYDEDEVHHQEGENDEYLQEGEEHHDEEDEYTEGEEHTEAEDAKFTPRRSVAVSDSNSVTTITPRANAYMLSPPIFSVQPPTPAPIPDPDTSPFHSQPSSTDSHTLHPSRPVSETRPSISVISPVQTSASMVDSPVDMHGDGDDARSASGEVGSDDDEESERTGEAQSRQNSFDRPISQANRRSSPNGSAGRRQSSPNESQERSIPPTELNGSVDGRRPSSRQSSRQGSHQSYDDFVVHHRDSVARSEASFGAPEGSIRSGSGYGKGGWAAAAASGSRSTSPIPVMFMPTSPNGGWGDFQPPPRQSRFTPLPPASQPMTFDRLLQAGPDGNQTPTASQHSSQNGSNQPKANGGSYVPGGSSPSEYSQTSDEEEEEEDPTLPLPSQSYAQYTSDASHSADSTPPAEMTDGVPTPRGWQSEEPIDHYADSEPTPTQPGSSWGRPPPGHRPISLAMPLPLAPPLSADRNPSPTMSRPQSVQDMHPMSSVDDFSRSTSPNGYPDGIPSQHSTPRGFDAPSFLDPDTITILPEMSLEDSAKTYQSTPSESGRSRASKSDSGARRATTALGFVRHAKSVISEREEEDEVPELPSRSKSAMGLATGVSHKWEGSSAGEGVLMESNGRVLESVSGYTNLVLPSGAYKPSNPAKSATDIDARILGLPHATMASITLSTAAHRPSGSATPIHLRFQLPPPVDFSSQLPPPTKVGDAQLLVQVYAVAVDDADIKALWDKGKADVGKWVPGRSFVGRCMSAGADEKDIVRGDIVVGLLDIRKSGALSEYILCDRRRLARAPYPTELTLEQMALLPLQGIPAIRSIRSHLVRHSRAIIMDAHMGVSALMCQEMSRAGAQVTAVIGGGEDSHEAQTLCMNHGARGVLTGSAAAVLLNLHEGEWDFILDTQGGQRVYDAAKRVLREKGMLLSLVAPDPTMPSSIQAQSRASGFKTLRQAFGAGKRKDSKTIMYEILLPAGTGEPEVDRSGEDYRDVLEGVGMERLEPIVKEVMTFEKGMEAFSGKGVKVVRLVN